MISYSGVSEIFLGCYHKRLSKLDLTAIDALFWGNGSVKLALVGKSLLGTFTWNNASVNLEELSRKIDQALSHDIVFLVAKIDREVFGFFRSEEISIHLSRSQSKLLEEFDAQKPSENLRLLGREECLAETDSKDSESLLSTIERIMKSDNQSDRALIRAYVKSHKTGLKELSWQYSTLKRLLSAPQEEVELRVNLQALLHRAAYKGFTNAVVLLGSESNLNQVDNNEVSALGLAVINNQISAAEQLLEQGADVNNAVSYCNFTAIHLAAGLGNLSMMEMLAFRKADLRKRSRSGLTALHLASRNNQPIAVRFLLEKAADLITKTDSYHDSALDLAASMGHKEVAEILVEKTGEDELLKAWHRAARSAHTSILDILISKGIDIDNADDFGYTALHHAATQGNLEMLRFLIENGADLNARTRKGRRPIDSAKSHSDAVNLLTRAEEERIDRLDSQFLYMKLMKEQGFDTPPYVTTPNDELFVTARVTHLEKWKHCQGVVSMSEILVSEGEWIATGRVLFNRFESLSAKPFVTELCLSAPVSFEMEAAREASETVSTHHDHNPLKSGGKEVYVGIVDTSIFFDHSTFRDPLSKGTRIKRLWVRNKNGTESCFKRKSLDKALKTKDPYKELGYNPYQVDGPLLYHGTQVAFLAAGNESMAPQSEILFYDLDRSTGSEGIIDAVRQIFSKATKDNRPCVVNLSTGSRYGARDGHSIHEEALDALVRDNPNRMIVIAAGNTYNKNLHYSGRILQGELKEIEWEVPAGQQLSNIVEIWYLASDELHFTLECPNRSPVDIPFGKPFIMLNDSKKPTGLIRHTHGRNIKTSNDSKVFRLEYNPLLDALNGKWKLRIFGFSVSNDDIQNLHGWISENIPCSDQFKEADPHFTLQSLATGFHTLAIAAHRSDSLESLESSSAGPTRDELRRPLKDLISAPGYCIRLPGPGQFTKDYSKRDSASWTHLSGTSFAAPFVTAFVANQFSERSLSRDSFMNSIRDYVKQVDNPSHINWDVRVGYGRLNPHVHQAPYAQATRSSHQEKSPLKGLLAALNPLNFYSELSDDLSTVPNSDEASPSLEDKGAPSQHPHSNGTTSPRD